MNEKKKKIFEKIVIVCVIIILLEVITMAIMLFMKFSGVSDFLYFQF